jgi:polar amino acid transport system substrate-binding protein
MAPAIKAAMTHLIQDGEYMKILTKWGITDGAIKTPVINGATS